MPLMVTRLRKSKAWVKARRNPALGFYMLNLWMFSWHEVPAGSMEDDDDVLADAAMCDPSKWGKVREDVLRGWVKCDDGRLYHPVVAERVLEAWASKVERKERNDHDRDRKAAERLERQEHFSALKAKGIHKPWNTPIAELRKAVQDLSSGQVADTSTPVHDQSLLRKGEGQGEGEGQGNLNSGTDVPAGSAGKAPADMTRAELWSVGKSLLLAAGMPKTQCGTFVGKLCKDYGDPIVIEAVRTTCVERPADPASYLTALCQKAFGQRAQPNKQTALEDRNQQVAAAWATGDNHATQ